MSTTPIAVDETQRLRSDKDNKRQGRERAEQRTQSCLAQTHCCDFMDIQTIPASIACQRTQVIRRTGQNPSRFFSAHQ